MSESKTPRKLTRYEREQEERRQRDAARLGHTALAQLHAGEMMAAEIKAQRDDEIAADGVYRGHTRGAVEVAGLAECICRNGARVTCPRHGAEVSKLLADTEARHRAQEIGTLDPTTRAITDMRLAREALEQQCADLGKAREQIEAERDDALTRLHVCEDDRTRLERERDELQIKANTAVAAAESVLEMMRTLVVDCTGVQQAAAAELSADSCARLVTQEMGNVRERLSSAQHRHSVTLERLNEATVIIDEIAKACDVKPIGSREQNRDAILKVLEGLRSDMQVIDADRVGMRMDLDLVWELVKERDSYGSPFWTEPGLDSTTPAQAVEIVLTHLRGVIDDERRERASHVANVEHASNHAIAEAEHRTEAAQKLVHERSEQLAAAQAKLGQIDRAQALLDRANTLAVSLGIPEGADVIEGIEQAIDKLTTALGLKRGARLREGLQAIDRLRAELEAPLRSELQDARANAIKQTQALDIEIDLHRATAAKLAEHVEAVAALALVRLKLEREIDQLRRSHAEVATRLEQARRRG